MQRFSASLYLVVWSLKVWFLPVAFFWICIWSLVEVAGGFPFTLCRQGFKSISPPIHPFGLPQLQGRGKVSSERQRKLGFSSGDSPPKKNNNNRKPRTHTHTPKENNNSSLLESKCVPPITFPTNWEARIWRVVWKGGRLYSL